MGFGPSFLLIVHSESLTVIAVFVVMPEKEFIRFNGVPVGKIGKEMNQGKKKTCLEASSYLSKFSSRGASGLFEKRLLVALSLRAL